MKKYQYYVQYKETSRYHRYRCEYECAIEFDCHPNTISSMKLQLIKSAIITNHNESLELLDISDGPIRVENLIIKLLTRID